MAQKPTAEAGILYVVPTPVGNLDDMTVRAVTVLKEVDVILAEDTRTSGVLMKHFGIETRMQSHHKFNEHETAAGIAQRLKGGERIARFYACARMPACGRQSGVPSRRHSLCSRACRQRPAMRQILL